STDLFPGLEPENEARRTDDLSKDDLAALIDALNIQIGGFNEFFLEDYSKLSAWYSDTNSEQLEARILAIYKRWGNETPMIETRSLVELSTFVFDNLSFPSEGRAPDKREKEEILDLFPFATRGSVLNRQVATYCCLSVARGNIWDSEKEKWEWTGKKYGNDYPRDNSMSVFKPFFAEQGGVPVRDVDAVSGSDLMISLYGHPPFFVTDGWMETADVEHFSIHRADSLFARNKLGFGGSDVLIPVSECYLGSPKYGQKLLVLCQKSGL
ncbi:MAG: hypothetical protein ACI9BD_000341, partial [Candidatus Marinamargulisbacteria bacterium]